MKLFKIDSQLKLNCSDYEENKKNDQLVFLIYDWSVHILLIQNNNKKKTQKKNRSCSVSFCLFSVEYVPQLKPLCHKHVYEINEPVDQFCLYESHPSCWRHGTAQRNTRRDGSPLIYVDWLEIASL